MAPLQCLAALFILWIAFFVMGEALLRIPSTYHDDRKSVLDDPQTVEKTGDTVSEDGGEDAGTNDANGDATSEGETP